MLPAPGFFGSGEAVSEVAREMVGRWGCAGHRTGLGASQSGQEWPYGVDGVAPATKGGRHRSPQIIEECYEQALIVLRYSRDRLTGWRTPF